MALWLIRFTSYECVWNNRIRTVYTYGTRTNNESYTILVAEILVAAAHSDKERLNVKRKRSQLAH